MALVASALLGRPAQALAAAVAELRGLGLATVNARGAVGLTLAGKNAARLLPRLLGL